jgi:hypothetical protein
VGAAVEWHLIERALAVLQSGDWHPHALGVGSLTLYLHTAIGAGRFLIGSMQGLWPSLDGVWPGELVLWSRFASAVCSVLTVVLIHRLAARWSPRAAVWSAALAAVLPTLVASGQLASADALAIVLVTGAWLGAIRAGESGETGHAAAAGTAAGLAGAASIGSVLAIPIVAVLVAVGAPAAARVRLVLVAFGSGAIAFLAASPYVWLDLPWFLNSAAGLLADRGARNPMAGLRALWTGLADPVSLLPASWDSLRLTAWVAVALAGTGLLILARDAARTERRPAALGGALIVFAFLWIALRGEDGRAAWPAVPALCVLFGLGVDAMGRALATRRAAGRLASMAAILVVATATARTIDRNLQRSGTSTTERLASWLAAQPPQAIAIEATGVRLPPPFTIRHVRRLIDQSLDGYRRDGINVLVSRDDVADRYLRDAAVPATEVAAYRGLLASVPVIEHFASDRGRAGKEPTFTVFGIPR